MAEGERPAWLHQTGVNPIFIPSTHNDLKLSKTLPLSRCVDEYVNRGRCLASVEPEQGCVGAWEHRGSHGAAVPDS